MQTMNLIEKERLYPLLFEPVYKQVFWGGTKLASVLGRPIPSDAGPIGEAWEICDRPEVETAVLNGCLGGVSIHQLVLEYGRDFVGSSFRGGRFPLLVKLIDAGRRLSLQVHPSESVCARLRDASQPKSEMWYIIDADPGSIVFAGLKSSATRQQFLTLMDSADVENLLQSFDSIPGDAYFINAGRIHTIGGGNLLLEIQQNSDTTFRISDWNRTDEHGKIRELHIEKALSSIDFMDRTVSRIPGASNIADHNRKYPLINRCPYFRTDELKLVEDWRDTTFSTRSFHILTAINMPVTVENSRCRTELPVGASCLIPACFGAYSIAVNPGTTSTVIRTTL